MREQVEFCEAIVADLMRLFPEYPSEWFVSNAATVKLGGVLIVNMPAVIVRQLLDAYIASQAAVLPGMEHGT